MSHVLFASSSGLSGSGREPASGAAPTKCTELTSAGGASATTNSHASTSSQVCGAPALLDVLLLTCVAFARATAGGAKRRNRRAGRRWHRAAPPGCAGSSPAPLSPRPSTAWTWHIPAARGLALPGDASALTDHDVLTHARRRVRRLKYDRQRGRGRRDGRRRLLQRRSRSRDDHASACCL